MKERHLIRYTELRSSRDSISNSYRALHLLAAILAWDKTRRFAELCLMRNPTMLGDPNRVLNLKSKAPVLSLKLIRTMKVVCVALNAYAPASVA